MMNRIVIVMPPVLPVPPVKGGAVETLMQMIIDENENNHKYDFIIFSTWDRDAERLSKRYKYTKYIYIKNQTIYKNVLYQCSRVCRKLTGIRPYFLDYYHKMVYQNIKKMQPDLCIIEGGSYTKEFIKVSKYLGAEKMVLHLHACFDAPNGIDKYFKSVIAISEFVSNQWLANSNANSYVVKNCIDLEKFYIKKTQEDISELRKSIGCSQGEELLIYCGRLIPVKGVKELILAVKKIDNVRLIVIGKEDTSSKENCVYYKELKKLTEDCSKVEMLGYVDNSKLPIYYQAADIAVVPSLWEEGAGIVVLEAMASRKPLIITDSGGMREYVPSEGCLIVKREDIIDDLCQKINILKGNSEMRNKMGEINYHASQEYSKQRYYINFCNVIERILHENENCQEQY